MSNFGFRGILGVDRYREVRQSPKCPSECARRYRELLQRGQASTSLDQARPLFEAATGLATTTLSISAEDGCCMPCGEADPVGGSACELNGKNEPNVLFERFLFRRKSKREEEKEGECR